MTFLSVDKMMSVGNASEAPCFWRVAQRKGLVGFEAEI